MMQLRSGLHAAFLVAWVFAASGARAAETGVGSTPSDSAAAARAHFELARRYVQVDEFRKAIEEFKAAHVAKPDAAFLYNIAECHRRLGEPKEAMVYYRRFMSMAASNNPGRPIARRRIAEMEAAHGAQGARAPTRDTALLPPGGAAAPGASPSSAGAAGPTSPAPVLDPRPAPEPPAGAVIASPSGAAAGEAFPDARDTGEAPRGRPLYKRGWFLATLGAVVVVGAVGVWALSSTGAPAGLDVPATPLGNQPIFRP